LRRRKSRHFSLRAQGGLPGGATPAVAASGWIFGLGERVADAYFAPLDVLIQAVGHLFERPQS
jgi:hypothetical protein